MYEKEAITDAAGLLVAMLLTATICLPDGISKSNTICAYGVLPAGKETFCFCSVSKDIEC